MRTRCIYQIEQSLNLLLPLNVVLRVIISISLRPRLFLLLCPPLIWIFTKLILFLNLQIKFSKISHHLNFSRQLGNYFSNSFFSYFIVPSFFMLKKTSIILSIFFIIYLFIYHAFMLCAIISYLILFFSLILYFMLTLFICFISFYLFLFLK